MSLGGLGDDETTDRVRLFPLPYFIQPADTWSSPTCHTRSARVRARRKLTNHVTNVANRVIYSLNRFYFAPVCLPPPVATHPRPPIARQQVQLSSPPTSSVHSRRVQPRAAPRVHLHSTSFSAPATRRQQRILDSVRRRCASFVLAARSLSSPNTNESSSVGSAEDQHRPEIVTDILRSYSFTDIPPSARVLHVAAAKCPRGSPDQHTTSRTYQLDDIEGPLSQLPNDRRGDTSQHAAPSTLPRLSAHSTSSTSVVPLLAHRVALPDTLNIVPLTRVLPPDVARRYSDAVHGAELLRPPMEILALDLLSPLKPSRVAGARSEYVALIRRMLSVGMVRMTAHPKAVNGVFTVGKDDDQDRLIIDAQPANRLFVDSPAVELPNPSHLVQLRVPTESHHRMSVGKSDLSNFYHHLGLPAWMVDYFALPPLTKDELRELGVHHAAGTAEHDADALWPACLTLPMGFSHAVHLAQTCHEHVVYSSGALSRDDSILCMRSPDVTADGAKHGIVVDDLFLFSLDQALAQRVFDRVLAAYAQAGFVVKPSKVVRPTTQPVKVIGFVVARDDQQHTVIGLAPDASLDLIRSTLSFLRRGVSTGLQLAHLLGRWTWCMLLCRPSLSVLQHSYRYIELAHRRRFTIWPSVRRELWMLIGLMPMMHARIDVPLCRNIVATDASEFAAGVVCTRINTELDRRIWQLCSSRRHAHVQTVLGAADDDVIARSPDARARLDEYAAFYTDVGSARWSTIISSAWRSPEHINSLELRAVLLALHWLTSYPSSHSSRVYLLVDSTVALYALWKGRTSSAPLLLILRKINALLMATQISLLTGWLPSAVNPADEPSRRRPPSDAP